MARKKIKDKEAVQAEFKVTWSTKHPLAAITFKFMGISCLLLLALIYFESKNTFASTTKNNHTLKKWNAFYELTENHEVDIVLVGNSHLYTGINPKNLSTALGCNAFILGSPGTGVVDHYYALEEAIKVNKPKLVVIETYGIKARNQQEMKNASLSDQIKSFNSRRDLELKMASTPSLFGFENYFYAWSTVLRNHNYLLTNYEQIEINKKEAKRKKRKNKKLYLGRFVTFRTGLLDTTLAVYDSLGSVVNGLEYEIDENAIFYTQKIIELCEQDSIELIFLTLPMHQQHVNDYNSWKTTLSPALGNYNNEDRWLDLQIPENYDGFSAESFENTLKENQHMTYNGSLIATYKLVNFIKKNENISLPDRSKDKEWRKLFYKEEGFFSSHLPDANDVQNRIIFTHKDSLVSELIHLKQGKTDFMQAKIRTSDKKKVEFLQNKLIEILFQIKLPQGQIQNTKVNMLFDKYHYVEGNLNFVATVVPLDIQRIYSIKVKEIPDSLKQSAPAN